MQRTAHQRSWMAWHKKNSPPLDLFLEGRDSRNYAAMDWYRREHPRPWSRIPPPCAGTDPCWLQVWPCSGHRSGQPGCPQLVVVERTTADGAVDDTGLVHTELHLTSLGVLHSRSHIRRHRAHFGVRHQATRAQDLTQTYRQRMASGRSDHHIEGMSPALTMAARSSIPTTSAPAAQLLQPWRLGANTATRVVLPVPWAAPRRRTTWSDFLASDTQLHSHVDGLIKLSRCCPSPKPRLQQGYSLVAFHLCLAGFFVFGSIWPFHTLHITPMERADQPMVHGSVHDRRRSCPSSWFCDFFQLFAVILPTLASADWKNPCPA